MRNAIGIDIGGTRLRVARIAPGGAVEARLSEPTDRQPLAALAQIERLAGTLRNAATCGAGIGVPGRVDVAGGGVLSGGYVDFSGIPLAGLLGRATRLPVFVDNDANMGLAAEMRLGAARSVAHAAMLTIGTGIGGALMLDGRIFRGRMAAGQLGHITVDIDGAECLCGRRGCLETASSGTALGRLIAEGGRAPSTTAQDLLESKDSADMAILARWAGPLRAGIDSLIATLDPELVVLGGGLGEAACAALARFPPLSPWYRCKVVPAQMGDDAGVVGAGLTALELGP